MEQWTIREYLLQNGSGHIIHCSTPRCAFLEASLVGMAMESGGHGIAIERLLKTARSQEGKNFGGFASDGIANGGIMEHG